MDITGNDATLREQQVFLLTTDETYTSIQSKIVKCIIYRLSIIFEREKEREEGERKTGYWCNYSPYGIVQY